MTTELMISMLRKGNTGAEILNILNSFVDINPKKETVFAVMMPSAGMILDHKGREVIF